MFKYHR